MELGRQRGGCLEDDVPAADYLPALISNWFDSMSCEMSQLHIVGQSDWYYDVSIVQPQNYYRVASVVYVRCLGIALRF